MPRITAPVRSRSARSQATKKALPARPEELICSATWVPWLPGRSTMATRPPSAANAAAMADPSPPAAPVMMAVVPVNRILSPHRASSDHRADIHPAWLPSGSRQGRRTDMTSQANHNLAALAEAAFHRLGGYESPVFEGRPDPPGAPFSPAPPRSLRLA